jgi:hypothetical protein
MILNVRGTSGSGKTFTVRSFKDKYGPDLIIPGVDGRTAAHVVNYNMVPVFFIGGYANICGGCDNVKTQDLVCSYVRHFSQFGHVIFEGLLISHSFMRYYELYKELTGYGIPFVFARMDTPLEICLDRVRQRRLAKGNEKELNTKNTEGTYQSTISTVEKFEEVGVETRLIKHKKDPILQIENILNEDKGFLFKNSFREERF